MNRKRRENESFEAYRAELKAEAVYFKQWAKGKLVWNSLTQGIYRNPERAEKKRLKAVLDSFGGSK